MKKIFLVSLLLLFAFACNQPVEKAKSNISDEYASNLKTAQTFFELFLTEDLDGQKPLICPGVTHYPPFYGAEPGKYDAFVAAGKGWMDAFDEITYNAEVWLPGTDSLGNPNGSVRTYGVWTAKNPTNGNVITTNAYHSFEFNAKGQIHEMRDYFDASGAMAAAMKDSQ
jgi:hypothetical protein